MGTSRWVWLESFWIVQGLEAPEKLGSLSPAPLITALVCCLDPHSAQHPVFGGHSIRLHDISCHSLDMHHILAPYCAFSKSISQPFQRRGGYGLHFTDEKTEAQSDCIVKATLLASVGGETESQICLPDLKNQNQKLTGCIYSSSSIPRMEGNYSSLYSGPCCLVKPQVPGTGMGWGRTGWAGTQQAIRTLCPSLWLPFLPFRRVGEEVRGSVRDPSLSLDWPEGVSPEAAPGLTPVLGHTPLLLLSGIQLVPSSSELTWAEQPDALEIPKVSFSGKHWLSEGTRDSEESCVWSGPPLPSL